jgi:hypothetical protein
MVRFSLLGRSSTRISVIIIKSPTIPITATIFGAIANALFWDSVKSDIVIVIVIDPTFKAYNPSFVIPSDQKVWYLAEVTTPGG